MVTYLTLDGCDGQYFHCAAYSATLSVSACARRHDRARSDTDTEFLNCRACEIGAMHAGKKIVKRPAAHLCARCGRESQRLIRGAICVSCYNREREYLLGRNAKGTTPTHARPVRAEEVCSQFGKLVIMSRVADTEEAMLAILRRSPGLEFVPPVPPEYARLHPQMELFA